MSLPNHKNIRNFTGEGIFRLKGTSAYITLGHTESISTNVEVTSEDIWSGITGTRNRVDVEITEMKASGSAVLRETGARQIGMALLSQNGKLVQAAQSGLTVSGTNAKQGDILDLGYVSITGLTATDGVDPLVEGTDYTLDAAAGLFTFLADQPVYDLAFGAAAITEANDQAVIAALSAPEGIEGDLIVIQRQKRGDRRFKWQALVRIFPDGELVLSREGTDKVTVPVRFDIIQDMTKPEGKQFGVLTELAD